VAEFLNPSSHGGKTDTETVSTAEILWNPRHCRNWKFGETKKKLGTFL